MDFSTTLVFSNTFSSYLASIYRLVDDLEHFDNQRPFDPVRLARLALMRLGI